MGPGMIYPGIGYYFMSIIYIITFSTMLYSYIIKNDEMSNKVLKIIAAIVGIILYGIAWWFFIGFTLRGEIC